ncbi:MAG: hypothetical protein IPO21_13510 [Bacteroidales bacterium]|nr:hypothetical protein [Bacteroidales bacterium]
MFIFVLLIFMPYRRLPNTDSARLRALETAFKKSAIVSPKDLAFSQKSHVALKFFLPTFRQVLGFQKEAYITQIEKSNQYADLHKKAKMYISHFIQVLNMTITREELPEKTRTFYGLDNYIKRLPSLQSDTEIIEWGNQLIEGENKRMMQGGAPMSNPRAAMLKVQIDKFKEAHRNQSFLRNNTNRALEKISSLRPEADDIILNIWNEVEEYFSQLQPEAMREKSKEYGLVYVFRRNEKNEESE